MIASSWLALQRLVVDERGCRVLRWPSAMAVVAIGLLAISNGFGRRGGASLRKRGAVLALAAGAAAAATAALQCVIKNATRAGAAEGAERTLDICTRGGAPSFVVNSRREILCWSRGMADASLLSSGSVVGKRLNDLPWADAAARDEVLATIAAVLATGTTLHFEADLASLHGGGVALAMTGALLRTSRDGRENRHLVVCLGRELADRDLLSLRVSGDIAASSGDATSTVTPPGSIDAPRMPRTLAPRARPGARPGARARARAPPPPPPPRADAADVARPNWSGADLYLFRRRQLVEAGSWETPSSTASGWPRLRRAVGAAARVTVDPLERDSILLRLRSTWEKNAHTITRALVAGRRRAYESAVERVLARRRIGGGEKSRIRARVLDFLEPFELRRTYLTRCFRFYHSGTRSAVRRRPSGERRRPDRPQAG